MVGVPLSKQLSKAGGHLIQIPNNELQMDGSVSAYDCVALTDQIRALDKTRFRRKAGKISQRGLNSILLGIQRLFGM